LVLFGRKWFSLVYNDFEVRDMKAERLNRIINYVNENGYCSNEVLSDFLNIPLTTLRRDLDELNNEQKLIRVYGGAKSIATKVIPELKIDEKFIEHSSEKVKIAKAAIQCIKPGEVIFLDAGSTTYQVAQLITAEMNLTIYTNSIENALLLSKKDIQNIILIPGKLKNTTRSIVGIEAVSFIDDYHFDVAFLGVNAIDEHFNYYTTDAEEAALKKKMIAKTELPFVLADHSKFNSISLVKFGSKKRLPVLSEED
jgi:DeoR family fructose operon transcriptional repressor